MPRFDDLPPDDVRSVATELGVKHGEAIDATVASPARIYNCLLGGKDNFEVDREAAQLVIKETGGEAVPAAKQNLLFACRAAEYWVGRRGIRQVLDIGMGIVNDLPDNLPTLERVVREAAPDTVLVGVDNDPMVIARSHALRSGDGLGYDTVMGGDVRHVDELFRKAEMRRSLSLEEPVLVVLAAVLHFVTDEQDPAGLLGQLHDRLPAGSAVAISHACSTAVAEPAVRGITSSYRNASASITFRTEQDILAMIEGAGWMPIDSHLPLRDVQRWAPPGGTYSYEGPPIERVRVVGATARSSKTS